MFDCVVERGHSRVDNRLDRRLRRTVARLLDADAVDAGGDDDASGVE